MHSIRHIYLTRPTSRLCPCVVTISKTLPTNHIESQRAAMAEWMRDLNSTGRPWRRPRSATSSRASGQARPSANSRGRRLLKRYAAVGATSLADMPYARMACPVRTSFTQNPASPETTRRASTVLEETRQTTVAFLRREASASAPSEGTGLWRPHYLIC